MIFDGVLILFHLDEAFVLGPLPSTFTPSISYPSMSFISPSTPHKGLRHCLPRLPGCCSCCDLLLVFPALQVCALNPPIVDSHFLRNRSSSRQVVVSSHSGPSATHPPRVHGLLITINVLVSLRSWRNSSTYLRTCPPPIQQHGLKPQSFRLKSLHMRPDA